MELKKRKEALVDMYLLLTLIILLIGCLIAVLRMAGSIVL